MICVLMWKCTKGNAFIILNQFLHNFSFFKQKVWKNLQIWLFAIKPFSSVNSKDAFSVIKLTHSSYSGLNGHFQSPMLNLAAAIKPVRAKVNVHLEILGKQELSQQWCVYVATLKLFWLPLPWMETAIICFTFPATIIKKKTYFVKWDM